MIEAVRKLLEAILLALRGPYRTPLLIIPGIGTGAAYASGDAFGGMIEINVPPTGIIHAALFYDYDNEKLGKTLRLSDIPFAATADNAAINPSDPDLSNGMGDITWATTDFAAYNANALGTKTAINLPYEAPNGKLYAQFMTNGADNIAAGKIPRFRLVIL